MSIGINLSEPTFWTLGISMQEVYDDEGNDMKMITIGLLLIEINIIF